jgi:hypothetical protein
MAPRRRRTLTGWVRTPACRARPREDRRDRAHLPLPSAPAAARPVAGMAAGDDGRPIRDRHGDVKGGGRQSAMAERDCGSSSFASLLLAVSHRPHRAVRQGGPARPIPPNPGSFTLPATCRIRPPACVCRRFKPSCVHAVTVSSIFATRPLVRATAQQSTRGGHASRLFASVPLWLPCGRSLCLCGRLEECVLCGSVAALPVVLCASVSLWLPLEECVLCGSVAALPFVLCASVSLWLPLEESVLCASVALWLPWGDATSVPLISP